MRYFSTVRVSVWRVTLLWCLRLDILTTRVRVYFIRCVEISLYTVWGPMYVYDLSKTKSKRKVCALYSLLLLARALLPVLIVRVIITVFLTPAQLRPLAPRGHIAAAICPARPPSSAGLARAAASGASAGPATDLRSLTPDWIASIKLDRESVEAAGRAGFGASLAARSFTPD